MIAKMLLCAAVALLAAAPVSQPQANPAAPPSAGQQASVPNELGTKAQPVSNDAGKPPSDDLELLAIEQHIIEYTNAERAKFGLASLTIDRELMDSAREHASWMARNRRLVHTSRPVGENIAMGQRDSRSAVADWMNSSGHRANILNRGYRLIGAAAYRTPEGTIYWCQQFRR